TALVLYCRVTTRLPLPSPTKWPASFGPFGNLGNRSSPNVGLRLFVSLRNDYEWLGDNDTTIECLFGQHSICVQNQFDRFLKICPRFIQGRALSIGAWKFLDET